MTTRLPEIGTDLRTAPRVAELIRSYDQVGALRAAGRRLRLPLAFGPRSARYHHFC